MITLAYSGVVACVFFMAVTGDLLGRKTLIVINLVVVIAGLMLIIFCQNIWMAGAGLFLCVFGGKNNINLVMMFMAETIAEKQRQFYMMTSQTMYAVGGLANVLWFYMLEDFELVLIFFYVIPSLVVLVGLVFFVKDTPISLLTKYSAKDAFDALSMIARVNKKPFSMTEEDIRNMQDRYINNVQ